jgi:hypothetical protein
VITRRQELHDRQARARDPVTTHLEVLRALLARRVALAAKVRAARRRHTRLRLRVVDRS